MSPRKLCLFLGAAWTTGATLYLAEFRVPHSQVASAAWMLVAAMLVFTLYRLSCEEKPALGPLPVTGVAHLTISILWLSLLSARSGAQFGYVEWLVLIFCAYLGANIGELETELAPLKVFPAGQIGEETSPATSGRFTRPVAAARESGAFRAPRLASESGAFRL